MSRTYRRAPYHRAAIRTPRHKQLTGANSKHDPFRRVGAIPPNDFEDMPHNKEAYAKHYIRHALKNINDVDLLAHKVAKRFKIPFLKALDWVEAFKRKEKRKRNAKSSKSND